MRISKIENDGLVYHVTFEPNWLEWLFGVEKKVKRYKTNGNYYTYGAGRVYIAEDGSTLGNGNWIGEAIDRWRNKF